MGVFNLSMLDGDEVKDTIDPNAIPQTQVLTPDTNVANKDSTDGKEVSEEKTIILDGPLSHIYTQALNLAYAKESTMMSLALFKTLAPDEQVVDSNEPYADDTYVYCVDDNALSESVVEGFEALREASKKYKNIIVALESGRVVTNRMQMISEFSESLGAKVCYTREQALKTVLSKVRKV